MADDVYVVDALVTGTQTIELTDDGTGSDWLTILGTYATQTDLRLAWTSVNGVATSAMGLYFNPLNTGHRLVVNGVIENIRGSDGLDYIQGNELGNILYGDQAASGAGDADSVYGYAGADTIYGGVGGDDLGGGDGNDRIFGGDGIDTISGGGDIDRIEGGAGADVLSGGSSTGDMVLYTGSDAGVQILITFGAGTTGVGGHAEGDSIFGFTHVTGSAHNDTITDTVKSDIGGGQNINAFYGGKGNDRLFLGGANDTGYGGEGNDSLQGEQGNDLLSGDAGNDTVRGGEGNDIQNGGDGNDIIFGDTGNDVLNGGAGNDLIRGGAGADRLTGALGADNFDFIALADSTVSSTGRDTVYDFSTLEGDKIRLATLDAKASTVTNDAFTFIGTAAFTAGVEGQLRVTALTSGYLVTGDVNGDRVADFAILVKSATMLAGTDFML